LDDILEFGEAFVVSTLSCLSGSRLLPFAFCGFFAVCADANVTAAQDIELKEKFGIWSLYCQKGATRTQYGNCAITAGIHAKDNAERWVKVAIAFANASGDLEMTVRTPFLGLLRNGVSLGFDGRQAVRGIFDTCAATSCESTISLDDRLLEQLGIGDKMSIEYQIAADQVGLFVLELDQMVRALASLEQNDGLSSQAIASVAGSKKNKFAAKPDPRMFVLERRKFEQGGSSKGSMAVAWKAPLKKCSGSPPTKKVLVDSNLTVLNEKDVLDWAEKSSKCANEVAVWIRYENSASDGSSSSSLDPTRLGSWTVYNSVSRVVPTGVVPEDGSRVPILPQTVGYAPTSIGGSSVGTAR
jgi:invasion protein IalB